jgi:hypothetical protein
MFNYLNCFFFYKQRKLHHKTNFTNKREKNRYILVHIYYFSVIIIICELPSVGRILTQERRGRRREEMEEWNMEREGENNGKIDISDLKFIFQPFLRLMNPRSRKQFRRLASICRGSSPRGHHIIGAKSSLLPLFLIINQWIRH